MARGEVLLSMKQAMDYGMRPKNSACVIGQPPRYHYEIISWRNNPCARAKAQMHHWYMHLTGGLVTDANNRLVCKPITVPSTPPRCERCFGIIGACSHTGGTLAEFKE